MEDFISLAVITFVAALAPLLSNRIPNKLIPETVLLLLAGALLGPHMANIIHETGAVSLLSDFGLAFLFLLAGYEINPKSITGHQGRRGFCTWVISLGIALVITWLILPDDKTSVEIIPIAIVMTTTAFGTILPILKERGLLNTRIGDSILAYGTYGELGPVLAMALLLSTRAEWKTVLILVLFVLISVLVAVISSFIKKRRGSVVQRISKNRNTSQQTFMRITIFLLAGLVAVSAIFQLDIILGAFAAGFILRYIVPEGDKHLESKLDGLAYGFFIPLFFVVSGAKIDLLAVTLQPGLLIGFIVMLLLVRAVPILIALSTDKETKDMSSSGRITVALYCTTALPLIVAVTTVAVQAGTLNQQTASVLVSAGAITVFLMPLLASLTYRIANTQPVSAVKTAMKEPRQTRAILSSHMALERILSRRDPLKLLSRRNISEEETIESLIESPDAEQAVESEDGVLESLEKYINKNDKKDIDLVVDRFIAAERKRFNDIKPHDLPSDEWEQSQNLK